MKAIFLSICLTLFSGAMAIGQLRHVKGIEDIGCEIYKSNDGFGGEAMYENFLSNSTIIKLGGYYEKRNIGYANYFAYGILPQLYRTILNNKRNIFIDLTGGMNFGYEYAKSEVADDKVNSFVIGERIGLSIEYYFTSSLKIEIQADQYFMQKSKFLKYGQIYSIGIACKI